jgi:hypothetical protein
VDEILSSNSNFMKISDALIHLPFYAALMAAIFCILDGCIYGFGLPILPTLVQDVSSDLISTNQTLWKLSAAVCIFHLGKSTSACFTACGIWESTIFSVMISALVFISCSFVSNIAWILVTRFILGLLSGYLGFFFQTSRPHLFSRLLWIVSLGISACLSGVLYVGSKQSSQPVEYESAFLHKHPALISACAVAALTILSFLCYVLLESMGFDETDSFCHQHPSYSQVLFVCLFV